jgi:hypothetical protein
MVVTVWWFGMPCVPALAWSWLVAALAAFVLVVARILGITAVFCSIWPPALGEAACGRGRAACRPPQQAATAGCRSGRSRGPKTQLYELYYIHIICIIIYFIFCISGLTPSLSSFTSRFPAPRTETLPLGPPAPRSLRPSDTGYTRYFGTPAG